MLPNIPSILCAGRRPDLSNLLRGGRVSFSGIKRYEWDLDDGGAFSPLWLEDCAIFPKLFWRSRSGAAQTLAVGAIVSGTLEELVPLLSSAGDGVRIFGGGRFDAVRPADAEWSGFSAEQFFIPQAEIIHAGGRTILAVNVPPGAFDPACIEEWVATLGSCPSPARPSVLTRWDVPNFDQWSSTVGAVLELIGSKKLLKAVLARRSRLELAESVSPHALIEVLMGASPGCFVFGIQPSSDSCVFLGASPELLYRRTGSRIESEAVAGTRPRSLDAAEDERLERQLLRYSKEQLEHGLVVESLVRTFRSLCESYECDEKPGVLKLSRVQHLRTALRGTLANGFGDDRILKSFHPTPATGGWPAIPAMEFLRSRELFDRGWYAGPFGCVSRDSAEFAVAIRSMLARDSRIELFAGAGIVEGSDAEREWAELEDKISGILNLLSA